jgi:hypothetical protein
MLQYLVGDGQYGFSYTELKENYERFKAMRDEEFLASLEHALHFAVFVCYIKEIPAYVCLSDIGVVHQLVHLIVSDTREYALRELSKIRETFNLTCALA